MAVQEFLNQRAVSVIVGGSYILPNWYDPQGKLRTFACRTTRVSPYRMIVEVPVVGKIGDRLTTYFRDFGKIDAAISDTMARRLTWIEKKQQSPSTVIELRKDARFIPPVPHTTLTLADGAIHPCFIIDCSVSGVAISSAVQPPVGMPLAVGACVGRVVRLLPNGIAVKFVEKQTLRDLDRLVARTVPAAVKVAVTAAAPVAAMSAVMA